jgi:Glycosyl hydrolase-like 10
MKSNSYYLPGKNWIKGFFAFLANSFLVVFASSLNCIAKDTSNFPILAPKVIESRIILDEDFSWLTRDEADRLLSRISKAGFNVLVPAVWHGRGVSWPSKLAPIEPRWANKAPISTDDPLKYLIERAHGMGIEVHPWFTVGLRQRDFLHAFYDDGTPREAFNIHLPAFRKYIVDVIMEVVNRYDLDGVNLDYVRSGMNECNSRNYYCDVCVSKFCVADYREKTNRDLIQDMALVKQKLDKTAFGSIADWNGRAVEEIVHTLRNKINSTKPHIVLSVDTHAGYDWVRFQGANAIKWANDGAIDLILHMEYDKFHKFRWPLINSAVKALHDPRKFVLMVGNYDHATWNKDNVWPRDAMETADLVRYSQKFKSNSNVAALYSCSTFTDEQSKAIRTSVFFYPAAPGWLKHSVK